MLPLNPFYEDVCLGYKYGVFMRVILAAVVFYVSVLSLSAKDAVSFLSKPLTAGKAMLTENGYIVSTGFGTANFSPEVRLPIQLVYKSTTQKTGPFGYGWSCPQLESSAVPQQDGVVWTAPWGEKLRFYAKSRTDKATLEVYKDQIRGGEFFSPYSDWEASCSASGDKFTGSGDWTFSGKGGYRGWAFTYRNAKLTTIQSSSGSIVSFVYNTDGCVSSISQNKQPFVEISYSGTRISTIRINGIIHTLSYSDGAVSILPKTPEGKITQMTRPRLVSITTEGLNPVELTYDEFGYLTQMKQGSFVDALTLQHGALEKFPVGMTEKERKAKLANNVAGRLVSDNQYTYSYPSPDPGKVRITDKIGQSASYAMDAQLGVFTLTEFSGKTYRIYYFMRHDVAYLGKVREVVDSRNRTVVSYRYDKETGKPIRTRDMAGNDVVMTYDSFGNLQSVARRGVDESIPVPRSRASYDAKGNPLTIEVLDENGKAVVTTTFQYDASGRPVKMDDGRTPLTVSYNSFGYPVKVCNVFGQTSLMDYDLYNRTISSTDSYGVKSVSTYTPSGLVVKMERRDGDDVLTSITVAYDGNGQPISYTDQRGRVKKFERDAFGRVVKEFFPDDSSVAYSYNAVGRVDSVLDQNKNKIKFDWDRFGIGGKTTAANQLTDYVYDESGMLSRVDSSRGGQIDRSIKYEYDSLDRIVKTTYADKETETFKYDSWGRIIETTRGDRKAVFTYDFFGRLTEKTEGTLINRYAYNAYGQRISRTTVDKGFSQKEERTYDKFGRLLGIKSGKDIMAYQYNGQNQIAIQIVNGTFIRFEYTKYGQLKTKKMDAGVPELGADEETTFSEMPPKLEN